MNHSDIYDKTDKGKQEITGNAAGLSMMERRVLILVNGKNDVDRLAKLSLCKELEPTVDRLLELGLIQAAATNVVEKPAPAAPADDSTTEVTATDVTATDVTATDVTFGARDLMCNTLKTFGNKIKIADLHNTIAETGDLAALKNLVDPWYHAISETPGGMYQADDLRKEVLDLMQREEVDAA